MQERVKVEKDSQESINMNRRDSWSIVPFDPVVREATKEARGFLIIVD